MLMRREDVLRCHSVADAYHYFATATQCRFQPMPPSSFAQVSFSVRMHILAPVLDYSTFGSIGYNRNRCSPFASLLALFDAGISAHFRNEILSFSLLRLPQIQREFVFGSFQ